MISKKPIFLWQARFPGFRPGSAGVPGHEVRPAGGQGGCGLGLEEVLLLTRHQDYRAAGPRPQGGPQLGQGRPVGEGGREELDLLVLEASVGLKPNLMNDI